MGIEICLSHDTKQQQCNKLELRGNETNLLAPRKKTITLTRTLMKHKSVQVLQGKGSFVLVRPVDRGGCEFWGAHFGMGTCTEGVCEKKILRCTEWVESRGEAARLERLSRSWIATLCCKIKLKSTSQWLRNSWADVKAYGVPEGAAGVFEQFAGVKRALETLP